MRLNPQRIVQPSRRQLGLGLLASAAALAVGRSAAAGSSPPRAGTNMGKNMSEIATLDWSMAVVAGEKLRIEYKVTSRAEKRFYLCDLLPVPGPKLWALGSKEIVVMNGPEADQVAFSRARVPSTSPLPFLIDPGARSIDPGQTVTGSAEVALPLRARHYRGTVAPLKGKPKTAILEIGYIVGDAHWSELQLDDGRKLTIPGNNDEMHLLRSDSKPIPQA